MKTAYIPWKNLRKWKSKKIEATEYLIKKNGKLSNISHSIGIVFEYDEKLELPKGCEWFPTWI